MDRIKIPNKKNLLISSIYRQWSIPKHFNIQNSKAMSKQIERWELVLNKWEVTNNENKDTIVMTYDNMDQDNILFNTKYKQD